MATYEAELGVAPASGQLRALLHANRAAAFLRGGQLSEAVRECNAALDAQPGFERALLRRARTYERLGHLELAAADLEAPARVRAAHRRPHCGPLVAPPRG